MAFHNKTLGCAANVIEGIARHQREPPACPGFQDRCLFRLNNFNSVDAKRFSSFSRQQHDFVSSCDVFQLAEEPISMACYSNIAVSSGSRCAGNPACSAIQALCPGVIENRNLEMNPRNSQNS